MSIPNFYRGDTKKYKILLKDKTTGDPISVNNGVLIFSMKKKRTYTEYLLQESVATTEADPLNPTGIIEITIPNTATETLPTGTVYYDFEYTAATGDVTTLLCGTVEILYDITI